MTNGYKPVSVVPDNDIGSVYRRLLDSNQPMPIELNGHTVQAEGDVLRIWCAAQAALTIYWGRKLNPLIVSEIRETILELLGTSKLVAPKGWYANMVVIDLDDNHQFAIEFQLEEPQCSIK